MPVCAKRKTFSSIYSRLDFRPTLCRIPPRFRPASLRGGPNAKIGWPCAPRPAAGVSPVYPALRCLAVGVARITPYRSEGPPFPGGCPRHENAALGLAPRRRQRRGALGASAGRPWTAQALLGSLGHARATAAIWVAQRRVGGFARTGATGGIWSRRRDWGWPPGRSCLSQTCSRNRQCAHPAARRRRPIPPARLAQPRLSASGDVPRGAA
jgi:hypothetical protein